MHDAFNVLVIYTIDFSQKQFHKLFISIILFKDYYGGLMVTNEILDNYLPVVIFTIIGVVFVAIALFMSRIVRPSNKTREKLSTYECAEKPIGDARIHFNIQYYLIVIVFLIFDVEVLFLYPWAVQFKTLGQIGFLEMILFIEVLVIGLAYAWRKEALEWIH